MRKKEDALNVTIGNNEPVVLTIYDTDQFSYQGNMIRFKRKGKLISGFERDEGRVKNLQFER